MKKSTKKQSHGKIPRERTKMVFDVLLDIGNGKFEEYTQYHTEKHKYDKNWKELSTNKLPIKTTLEILNSLMTKKNSKFKRVNQRKVNQLQRLERAKKNKV